MCSCYKRPSGQGKNGKKTSLISIAGHISHLRYPKEAPKATFSILLFPPPISSNFLDAGSEALAIY